MSIRASHLREMVIRPVLERMDLAIAGLKSSGAEELLIGTAAQESQLGRSLRQHPTGPARGIYQMEPATLNDLLTWLRGREALLKAVLDWSSPEMTIGAQVAGNLYLATAIARANYYRKPFAMPGHDDVDGLAAAWKQWWNTPLGAGTVEQFVSNYRRYADS